MAVRRKKAKNKNNLFDKITPRKAVLICHLLGDGEGYTRYPQNRNRINYSRIYKINHRNKKSYKYKILEIATSLRATCGALPIYGEARLLY